MNKIANALLIATFTATLLIGNARADSVKCNPCKHTGKVVPVLHTWQAKKKPASCNQTASFPAPELVDYQDSDTPAPTLYYDYVSDFQWWLDENNICSGLYKIEPNPYE